MNLTQTLYGFFWLLYCFLYGEFVERDMLFVSSFCLLAGTYFAFRTFTPLFNSNTSTDQKDNK